MKKSVDADSHIYEGPQTWKYFPEEFHARRPIPVELPPDTAFGPFNAFWLIDGNVFPKMVGRGQTVFPLPSTVLCENLHSLFGEWDRIPIGSQDLTDVPARLKEMDKLHADVQIVFPTVFLTPVTDEIRLEQALFHAYNRFMAEACSSSEGRLKWAGLVSMGDPAVAVQELRNVKELGASTVMTLGFVHDRPLSNKQFFPFYEEASHLDMPISIHFGWGPSGLQNVFDSRTDGFTDSFITAVLPPIMGLYTLIAGGVLDAFPRLKVGVLETGSEWAIYASSMMQRFTQFTLAGPGGKAQVKRKISDYFRDGRIYVCCEAEEDILALVKHVGEDCIITSTDFPHGDPTSEIRGLDELRQREDIPDRIKEKIFWDNPACFFNLQ
jgi:predicted TIM-barrel fold metal-dependent hydrolase